MSWLLATLVLAVPAVRVDGSALADEHARQIVGHVVERLLEIGVAVDPRAEVTLILAGTDDGYAVTLQTTDGTTATEPIEARGRELAVVELDVVQVAVDLARDHATPRELGKDGIHVAVHPAAEARRGELLGELAARGLAIAPTHDDASTVVCIDARDDGFVLATGETVESCDTALASTTVRASISDAVAAMTPPATRSTPPAMKPSPTMKPPPVVQRRRRPTLGPWSIAARIGLGFAWRPRTIDAAPSIGFEAAAQRGLAIGFDATVLPSRSTFARTADTLLAAGLGYRASVGTRLHLGASLAAGLSVHAARIGRDRDTRVDPLLALPIQLEGDVHRNIALGLRFTVATTFRARSHAISGIEVWRRGPVLVMLAATARFGG